MYAYIFDSFLQERKYAHDITQIENRLSTLGIQGRIEKMTILKNVQEAARQAVKRGATTIVVVGNDETVSKVLPQLIDTKVTLGLIPLGPHQTIAHILGLPDGVAACDCVSRRVIRHLDMGCANSVYFLFNLQAPANTVVDCGTFQVSSLDPEGSMTISNFSVDGSAGQPDDGRLELIVTPGQSSRGWTPFRRAGHNGSIFSITKAKITSTEGPANVTLDGQVILKTPITIEVAPHKLDIIVGKDRAF